METMQDLIKGINESGWQEAPITPPTPAATTPQTQPPVPAQTQVPPAEPEKTPDPALPDPSFVKPIAETPGKEAPAAQTAPATTSPAEPAQQIQVFNSRLSELTDGTIKTEEEFGAFVERYNQLVEQAEKGFQPQFKDERAKLVYQLLTDNAGNEPEAAMRTLRAMNFKPEGKSEKDFLFEGYLLDPKNSDLTPLQAQEYFEAEYQHRFQDLDSNPLRQRELQLAVKDAKGMIEKVQSDFKVAEEGPRQISEQVENGVLSAVEGFGGVRLSFSDNPQETEILNVALDDPQELAAIQREMLDPAGAHNEFLSQFDFKSEKGYQDMAREVYERRNHKELRMKAFEHGRKLGQLDKVNEIRNASNPRDISRVAAPAGQKPKGFYQSWEEAAQASK